eukprot:1145600-Pleurochrysis_carterae.AAC.5
MRDIPRDPIGCIRSATMLYVMSVATNMKTMLCMGLCDTILCKCGHPVATPPATKRIIRRFYRKA